MVAPTFNPRMSFKPTVMDSASSILRGDEQSDIDAVNAADAGGDISADILAHSFDKIHSLVDKLDNHSRSQITAELSYLRLLVDLQTNKIDKLTAIVSEVLENKNQQAILSSLHAIQNEESQNGNDEAAVDANVDSMAQPGVHLDSNMDPELHQVAVAAAAVRAQLHISGELPQHIMQPNPATHHLHQVSLQPPQNLHGVISDDRKRSFTKMDDSPNGSGKKPKISIDFLHNPMTVREIYEEFTKGFRGQPALCEMDARFGKHEWRGDLRSKQSKRYQRRKKLCDAITRGMQKYDKSADEIIGYIEEFRGDKLLTWVMNGNLPADLMG